MRKRPLLTEAEKKKRQRIAQTRWRKLNPDYQRNWYAANKEYVKLEKRKYRARKETENADKDTSS
jgi:hypothetical protein